MGGAAASGGAGSKNTPFTLESTAPQLAPTSTTFTVTNLGISAYTINGSNNPTLTLTRGETYTFTISASGHPFDIKTVQGNGAGNKYLTGVTGESTQNGTLTFTVPMNAPDKLFYDCEVHAAMTGVINIIPEPGSAALAAGATLLWAVGWRRRQRPM